MTTTIDAKGRFGPLGALLAHTAMRYQFKKQLRLAQRGLKHYVQHGETLTAK